MVVEKISLITSHSLTNSKVDWMGWESILKKSGNLIKLLNQSSLKCCQQVKIDNLQPILALQREPESRSRRHSRRSKKMLTYHSSWHFFEWILINSHSRRISGANFTVLPRTHSSALRNTLMTTSWKYVRRRVSIRGI